MKFIKRCFIIGLIGAGLIGLVFWILKSIWSFLQPFKYLTKIIFGKTIPGLEILVILIFILIIGIIINFLEKKIGPIDKQVKKISFIHRILNFFSSIKNTVSHWLGEKSDKNVQKSIYVAVEIFPGFSVLGMTSYNNLNINKEDRVAVAIISWPFPTTGPIIAFVRKEMIYELNEIPPEIVVQTIMSATLLKLENTKDNTPTEPIYTPI
jgi:uncharacterized membrane protein